MKKIIITLAITGTLTGCASNMTELSKQLGIHNTDRPDVVQMIADKHAKDKAKRDVEAAKRDAEAAKRPTYKDNFEAYKKEVAYYHTPEGAKSAKFKEYKRVLLGNLNGYGKYCDAGDVVACSAYIKLIEPACDIDDKQACAIRAGWKKMPLRTRHALCEEGAVSVCEQVYKEEDELSHVFQQ